MASCTHITLACLLALGSICAAPPLWEEQSEERCIERPIQALSSRAQPLEAETDFLETPRYTAPVHAAASDEVAEARMADGISGSTITRFAPKHGPPAVLVV